MSYLGRVANMGISTVDRVISYLPSLLAKEVSAKTGRRDGCIRELFNAECNA